MCALEDKMAISVGDRLPDASFKVITSDGPAEVATSDIFPGKTVVLFAVPGAYTPTCHMNHLPGFLDNIEALKAKGVDSVAVVSVNDMWVMDQWSKDTGGKGKIQYLSDGSADFTKAIGMELDASGAGMGIRSKRYAMIVKDGVVTTLNVEDVPSEATLSGAAPILSAL